MKISFLGHACFLIESEGIKIVTDPYDSQIGFPLPSVSADIVTVSHSHFDHSATAAVGGNPTIIKSVGESVQKGVKILGVQAYHDSAQGAERGPDIIFKFTLEGINLCHLGDLGHILSQEQIEQIGPVDILMIPTGGVFSLDGQKAKEVVAELKPTIILPMHFKEEGLNFELEPVENFLKIADMTSTNQDYLEINSRDALGQKRIILLKRINH